LKNSEILRGNWTLGLSPLSPATEYYQMKTKTLLTLWLAILLTGCAQPATSTPTEIAASSATFAPSATVPATATSTPISSPAATVPSTPAPIPADRQIVLASNELGDWNLFRMNLDGSGKTQLTLDPGDEWAPAWSPDGSQLAYQSKQGENWQIVLMNWDGSQPVQLTSAGNNENPSWSPDGNCILFDSDREGNRDVYWMDHDGANQLALTNDPRDEFAPAWSPDGSQIAYLSEKDATEEECTDNAVAESCPREIFLLDAQGMFLRKLGNGKIYGGFSVVWSPDSTHLAELSDYFEGGGFSFLDLSGQEINSQVDLREILGTTYQTGPVVRRIYILSFAFSPLGENGVFCALEDLPNKAISHVQFSGCYLVGMHGEILYTLERVESRIPFYGGGAEPVRYGYAVWQP
jgi:dipeptidyl aminopeptidase/acylaminoacyl peptidase